VDYTKPIELGIADKLRNDKGYRNAFFRGHTTDSIAQQIRKLRKLRDNMKQSQLAEAAGMKQSAISRIEQAEYSSWTFNTLWRVAEALGARLIVDFQPIEDAIKEYEPQTGLRVYEQQTAKSKIGASCRNVRRTR
jgi:transcriptional regulator with XRE-family HTH domain